jgi:transcriptional regulator with XRE-family HTH domain
MPDFYNGARIAAYPPQWSPIHEMNVLRTMAGEKDMSTKDTSAQMTFGQVIRQRRVEMGLTQEALADRVGDNVRQADISRLERDYISMPRRSRLEALAQALEVSPGYLLMQSGWFDGDEELRPELEGDTVKSFAGKPEPPLNPEPQPDLPGDSAAWDRQTEATATASQTLHEAIRRARQLSNQTRDVLSQSSNTISRAGQIRRRRD